MGGDGVGRSVVHHRGTGPGPAPPLYHHCFTTPATVYYTGHCTPTGTATGPLYTHWYGYGTTVHHCTPLWPHCTTTVPHCGHTVPPLVPFHWPASGNPLVPFHWPARGTTPGLSPWRFTRSMDYVSLRLSPLSRK